MPMHGPDCQAPFPRCARRITFRLFTFEPLYGTPLAFTSIGHVP